MFCRPPRILLVLSLSLSSSLRLSGSSWVRVRACVRTHARVQVGRAVRDGFAFSLARVTWVVQRLCLIIKAMGRSEDPVPGPRRRPRGDPGHGAISFVCSTTQQICVRVTTRWPQHGCLAHSNMCLTPCPSPCASADVGSVGLRRNISLADGITAGPTLQDHQRYAYQVIQPEQLQHVRSSDNHQ